MTSTANEAPAVPTSERLTLLSAGIRFGYQAGHNDTVEACYGRPAPAHAGEVGELVVWLRETGDQIQPSHLAEHQRYQRAADLLERQASPVPVAVSERLPHAEDCDADGFIWLWDCDRRWVRQRRAAASSNTWTRAHWLPGWFLPLPSGDVE